MTSAEFWKLSKDERNRVRQERWNSFLLELEAKRNAPKPEPKPTRSETLTDRFPATVYFESAEQIIYNHSKSIAKFDIDSLIEDVRSFGQSEFERGIEFAMKQFNQ